MTGIEITFLIIGLIILAASFILTERFDRNDSAVQKEMTEKQREDIRKQIMQIFDEQMDALKEQTEVSLDKLSAEKMNEMNEYSETILNEINRNHNEVMFLYDMLNEKKKEINNTVRDLNIVNKELKNHTATESGEAFEPAKKAPADKPKQPVRTKKEQILDQLDGVSESVSDEVTADDQVAPPAKPRRKNTAKTAAERTRNAVKKETEREENKDITVFENGNNNEKILELSRQGKSNVEIAKELGLGIGEVKLVVDLFKGGR